MLKNNKIMKYFRSHTIFFHIISVILWLWTLALAFLFVYGIVISLMDGFEYSYLPNDLIAVFSDKNMYSVYTHKFDDMNMTEVMYRAWSKGIKCFCVFGRIQGYEDF